MDAKQGFSVLVGAVTQEALANFLSKFLAEEGVFGLVEGLAAAVWLRGQGLDQAEVFEIGDEGEGAVKTLGAEDVLGQWPRGRVFHELAEWRWCAMRDANEEEVFQVLGLSEERELLAGGWGALGGGAVDGGAGPVCGPWRVAETTQFLVGSIPHRGAKEMNKQMWSEVRNPRALVYPVAHGAHGEQPRLAARTYASERGAMRFVRGCRVFVR